MRTKLIRMTNIESVLQKINKVHMPNEKDLEVEIKKELAKGHLFYIQKDENYSIIHGNKVTIKISGNIPKFNKDKVSINVGSKLYSEIVEKALLGLKVGSSENVVINGETIAFTVLKVEELCYPELTDDMVAEKNIEDVKTIEQYKAYYLANKQNEVATSYVQEFLEELIAQSEFAEINEDDVKEVTDQQFYALREHFLQGDMDLETLSEEEWIENFYNPDKYPYYKKIYPDIALLMCVRNKQEFYESLHLEGETAIQTFLVLSQLLAKENPEEFDPTKVLKGEKKLVDEYIEKTKIDLIKKEGR